MAVSSYQGPASIGLSDFTALRTRLVAAFGILGLVISGLGLAVVLLTGLNTRSVDGGAVLAFLVFVTASGLALWLIRHDQLEPATLVLIATYLIAFFFDPTNLLAGTLVLLLAATQASSLVLLMTALVVFGGFGLRIAQSVALTGGFTDAIFIYTVPMAALVILVVVTRVFVNSVTRAFSESARASAQLDTGAGIQRIVAGTGNVNDVLMQSVALIQERFGYDRVQVFLLNARDGQATLAASTHAPNTDLRLPVSAVSTIGQVALRGTLAVNPLTAARYRPEDDALRLKSGTQIALPLKDGQEVVAVLDLQSARTNAFSPTDQRALQIIADLLATGLRNVRLIEAQSAAAEENRRQYERAEEALREVERLNRELTRASWQGYTAERMTGITLQQETLLSDDRWTDALARASSEGKSVTRQDGEQQIVAVPVMLRGEVIGAIEVEPGAGSEQEALGMMQAVASRLAISLENARLFEEAQEMTAQEQRISEIAARYQEVGSVDELLRITLDELSDALGAERASIRLGAGASELSVTGEQKGRGS
ncbi:MAG: GAF domain-containing protein [Pleurocapsa minor GSE-CHR-MK-17-07R]|jgi:GAF domain-containing protein|nr:GAF domain-containing protein [Pleurocapsa minor GSE-CHR-MK 17-07R]